MNRNPNGPKSNFGPRWEIKVDLYNPCSGADRVPLSIDVPVRVKEIDIAYAVVGFYCGQKKAKLYLQEICDNFFYSLALLV